MAKRNKKQYEPGTLAFFAIVGILFIGLGVVSLLAVLGVLGGSLFTTVKQIMQGLGGSLCIGVSVLMIITGVLVAFSSGKAMPMRGLALVTVLFFSVLAIINLLSKVGQFGLMDQAITYNATQYTPPLADASGYWNVITAGYRLSAASGMFGGALGMLLAWPAWTFLGTALSVAVLALLCVLCVLFFTGFDFTRLFSASREKSAARSARKAAEEEERRREQMVFEQQRQAALNAADLNKPSYLRRGKAGENPAPAVNPYGLPPGAAPMPNPYFAMNPGAYPQPIPGQTYAPGNPAMPPQPDLYNEIIVPQDKQPLWRRTDKKKEKAKSIPSAAQAFQTRMTFTPSEMGTEAEEPPEAAGNSVILSPSKRRTMDRLEQICQRKAEINQGILESDLARAEEETLPPIAEPVIVSPRPVAVAVDRDKAYRRPAPAPEPKQAARKEPAPLPEKQNVLEEKKSAYVFPTIELLNLQQRQALDTRAQDTENAAQLEKTLESFGIPAKVQRVTHGPAVTRFELGLISSGINVKRIMSIADNIALDMAANGGVRIEIPIPGTNLFGIEVPNREIQSITLAEVLLSPEMQAEKSPLSVALGKDIAGRPVLCNLAKMPHLLIAGQTGSGKSVCINAIINSLLYRTSPEEVRMIMIDPKVVELQCYNAIPHLLIPVVSDPHKAAGALSWAVAEMLDRYHKMQQKNVRELSSYNAKLGPGEDKLPRIVIIIDELSDLMLACKKDVEESIIRLAQLARAAGIHMVVATQRPTVDVITGLIKANIPSRIAFAVSSGTDSRTILDQNGAEKLLGKGDMFYFPTGASAPIRVQGCFMSDAETERVVDYIGQHSQTEFDPNIIEAVENEDNAVNPLDDGGEDTSVDDRLAEAMEMVINDGQASISMLQRRMKIGYARAGRLIDDMAARGVVSKSVGSKPREVLMSKEEFEKLKSTLL